MVRERLIPPQRKSIKQTRKARLEAFRAFKVRHPLLMDAYDDLRCVIRDSNPGSIIFACGPTGVGKTTLLEHIADYLKEITLHDLAKDQGRIPVVISQVVAPTSNNFDWKDYFKRLLTELEEPLVDYKLEIELWGSQRSDDFGSSKSNLQLISSERPATRAIRIATERTLKRRRFLAVLLDDAQHLGVTSSGRQLLNQLNILKSLADKSKTTHVLCGTYELIPLRNLNGQLSRRSLDIHFGRYRAESETHRQQFINVLYTFQQRLPLEEIPDLTSRWDYFYERSIGCVGILKDWLTRSLAMALEEDSPTLKFKYLERRALSIKQCATILSEAMLGEKEFVEAEVSRSQLRRNLGLEAESLKVAQDGVLPAQPEESAKEQKRRRQPRVGRRKPVRDKIGAKVA
jgi:energy-coupling factor transporter ATP-binding protein EcfA2